MCARRPVQTEQAPSAKLLQQSRRRVLALFGLGGSYYVFVRFTGKSLPCPFLAVTGHWCPGCGITRMVLSLTRADLRSAWQANPLLLILSPYLIILLIRLIHAAWTGRSLQLTRSEQVVQIGLVCLLLVFGILRNIPAFAFLAPQAGSMP